MRIRVVALLGCLLCGGGAWADGWRVNLVSHPSAESDANQDGSPDGWEGSAFKSPAKLAWDRSVGHHGRACLRIQDSANPGHREWNEVSGRWICQASRAVKAGQTYTLSVWIRTKDLTGGSATACIAWNKGGHWVAESYTPRVTGTSDWRYVTVTAKAPPQADGAKVYLCHSRAKGTAWFDDVCLLEGTGGPGRMTTTDPGSWKGQALRYPLPFAGRHVLRGVPFEISSEQLVMLSEGSAIAVQRVTKEGDARVVTVGLNKTCRTLYFLHGSHDAKPGRAIGRYELLHQDGTVTNVPLRAGRDVFDLYEPRKLPQSVVAWRDHTEGKQEMGLSLFAVANPKPDKPVRAVRICAEGDGTLVVAGLTLSEAAPIRTDPPIPYEYTDKTGWYTWDFPLNDTNLDTINLTRFLDAPAGKHGFLSVDKAGRFRFADGTRGRFFGTNLCGPRCFPDKAQAPNVAARLAKYGMNMVRLHAIDGRWGGLFDFSHGDSRRIDADKMDRLDFLVAELKKRGIYVYFDLLDYRRFLPGDGVTDADKFQHGWTNSIKGATIFNDRLIELQQEFATQFLTHRNPYTKRRYVDDPAVAVVETTNENSVFYFHNTSLTLPVYRAELKRKWNAWLRAKYPTRAALAKAWTNDAGRCALEAGESPAKKTVVLPLKYMYHDLTKAPWVGPRSPVRVRAMLRFLFEIERDYYKRMHAHLRKIGLRAAITGTNQTFCPASTCADACADFMSRNNYWCHPAVRAKPYVRFRNLAVLDSDLARTSNPMTNVASSTVVGKGMIVPEFNFPWPNEYRAECLPLMTAYALLQDWDGLLFFAYNYQNHHLEHFSNQSDPVRWGQVPAAALMWHRRDVAAAKHTVEVAWSEADVFAGGPTHRKERTCPFRYLTYVSKVRNRYPGLPQTQKPDICVARSQAGAKLSGCEHVFRIPAGKAWDGEAFAKQMLDLRGGQPPSSRLVSDTGQLCLDTSAHTFTMAAPRSIAFVGRLDCETDAAAGVTVLCQTPFAAVLVTALDDKPIAQSRRLLITAVARAENTGQGFLDGKKAIPQFGRAPVQAEPVLAHITLSGRADATAYVLDPTGKRLRILPTRESRRDLALDTADAKSPWIEVVSP